MLHRAWLAASWFYRLIKLQHGAVELSQRFPFVWIVRSCPRVPKVLITILSVSQLQTGSRQRELAARCVGNGFYSDLRFEDSVIPSALTATIAVSAFVGEDAVRSSDIDNVKFRRANACHSRERYCHESPAKVAFIISICVCVRERERERITDIFNVYNS